MPDGEGIETVRAICAAAPSLPILVISGGAHQEYSDFAVALGATARLSKPFISAELIEQVAALLSSVAADASLN
jgi:DNA-binding NarL/FixJ family response regulator